MAALDAEVLPASPENQAIVKAMLEQDEDLPEGLDGTIYGKTGSCIGEPNAGVSCQSGVSLIAGYTG